jgi:XTP/dITP diphosphohydrolase
VTRRVALATNNVKKLVELRRIVADAGPELDLVGLADLPPYPEPAETASSFEGNAVLKARACAECTGLPAVADDSGLAVDVLNGMPGVRSARWAGPAATDADNNELLLRQLFDVSPARRTARFVCAAALVLPDGTHYVRLGEVGGLLTEEPRGGNGFGYDPLFIPEGHTLTNAELSAEEKDAISHRAKALRALVPVLVDLVVPLREGRP